METLGLIVVLISLILAFLDFFKLSNLINKKFNNFRQGLSNGLLERATGYTKYCHFNGENTRINRSASLHEAVMERQKTLSKQPVISRGRIIKLVLQNRLGHIL